MEKVLNNKYVTFWWSKEVKVIKSTWHESTELLSEKGFRAQLLHEVEVLKKYRPEGYIVDTCNFRFTITPKFQEWIDKNIFPHYGASGVKRVAFVASKEFIAQLSIEQAAAPIQERHGISQTFFDEENEAFLWVKNEGSEASKIH